MYFRGSEIRSKTRTVQVYGKLYHEITLEQTSLINMEILGQIETTFNNNPNMLFYGRSKDSSSSVSVSNNE